MASTIPKVTPNRTTDKMTAESGSQQMSIEATDGATKDMLFN